MHSDLVSGRYLRWADTNQVQREPGLVRTNTHSEWGVRYQLAPKSVSHRERPVSLVSGRYLRGAVTNQVQRVQKLVAHTEQPASLVAARPKPTSDWTEGVVCIVGFLTFLVAWEYVADAWKKAEVRAVVWRFLKVWIMRCWLTFLFLIVLVLPLAQAFVNNLPNSKYLLALFALLVALAVAWVRFDAWLDHTLPSRIARIAERRARDAEAQRLHAAERAAAQRERDVEEMERMQRERDTRNDWRRAHSAYTRSPQWKRLRERLLKKANHTCENCGGEASHVHHKQYTKRQLQGDFSVERLANLQVLCPGCHVGKHAHFRRREGYDAAELAKRRQSLGLPPG